MDDSKYLILSCDGGGIRGVVTALLLQELGQNFLDKVCFFAGTSTGSIIALGLASGIKIGKLVKLYKSDGKCNQIFSPSSSKPALTEAKKLELRAALESVLKDSVERVEEDIGEYWKLIVEIIEELIGPSFTNDGRKELLEAHFTSNPTLASLSHQALVTTFQLNSINAEGQAQWSAATLHNLPNLPNSNTSDTLTVDAIMCSSSAPLYFPPYQLPSGVLCVDGGVFANNPSTVALASLLGSKLLGQDGLKNVYMLSVGTGVNLSSFPYNPSLNTTSEILAAIPYGILGWLWPENEPPVPPFPLLEVMFDGSSQINDAQASMLLPSGQYIRANVSLGENQIPLDDCNSIGTLEAITSDYIANSPDWQKVLTWVQTNFGEQA